MSATGSSGSLLECYAGIRSAVNAIRTHLIDSLTGPSNRVLRACSTCSSFLMLHGVGVQVQKFSGAPLEAGAKKRGEVALALEV